MSNAARAEVLPAHTGSPHADTQDDVEAWVHHLLAEGPIAHFEVVEAEDERVRVGAIPGTDGSESLAGDVLGERLWRMMSDDASAAAKEYRALCYRDPKDSRFEKLGNTYQARKLFRIGGSPGFGAGSSFQELSQSINAALAMQCARTAERAQEIALSTVKEYKNYQLTSLTRQLESQERRLSAYESREDASRAREESLRLSVKLQDAEALKAKREDRQHELMFKTLSLAIPAMASRLLPAGSGEAPLQGDALKDFFDDVSPKQWKAILGSANLSPEQLIAFQTIQEAVTQGKFPALADTIVEEFFTSFEPPQWKAIMSVLREDQLEKLEPVVMAYHARKAARDAEGAKP